jgi:hypothetical protein
LALSALALNCTLKRGEQKSSTQKLLEEILKALAKYKVSGETVRVVDLEVKPGVSSDEGEGDDWPSLRTHSRDRHSGARHTNLARPAIKRCEART